MRELLANLGAMLRSSWRADRRRTIGALVTTALVPVTRPMRAIGLGVMADGIVDEDLRAALTGAAIVAGLTAANRILDWASVTVRMRLREHTILFLDEEVIELTARAPGLAHHEQPEHQDQMELLRSHRQALVNPFMPIAWSLAAVVQLVATVFVFARLDPILALLPLAGIPALVLGLRAEHWVEEAREATAQDTRLAIHLMELATLPPAGKEVRIFGLGDELVDRYRTVMRRVERRHASVDIRSSLVMSGAWAVFAVAYMAAVGFVAGRVIEGALTVGAVVTTLSLGAQINGQLADLVDNSAWFSRTARAVSRYRWLRRYVTSSEAALAPPTDGNGDGSDPGHAAAPRRLDTGISFHDVSFTYPGTSRPVLTGVDLDLPAGSTVAIVGENGAGKTTLIKLLLRFYEPTRGRITVDGVDLARIPMDDWRARTSAAFQDFARLQLLARHSIGVGRLADLDDDPTIAGAMHRAAADDLHAVLPDGLGTMLGREFDDGIDLSIGQWQKLAIARSMMRAAPLLLILDEPTASLDAPTEHQLFDHFTGAAHAAALEVGAITVLVSHRFSTVRTADQVLVVAGNRIAEAGSHEELIALGGLYAELYTLQASSYT
jgi:ATP-binding cassette subfamily B protein